MRFTARMTVGAAAVLWAYVAVVKAAPSISRQVVDGHYMEDRTSQDGSGERGLFKATVLKMNNDSYSRLGKHFFFYKATVSGRSLAGSPLYGAVIYVDDRYVYNDNHGRSLSV